jgi:hypothetical protein
MYDLFIGAEVVEVMNGGITYLLPLFGNIRCFNFVKWVYLDIF